MSEEDDGLASLCRVRDKCMHGIIRVMLFVAALSSCIGSGDAYSQVTYATASIKWRTAVGGFYGYFDGAVAACKNRLANPAEFSHIAASNNYLPPHWPAQGQECWRIDAKRPALPPVLFDWAVADYVCEQSGTFLDSRACRVPQGTVNRNKQQCDSTANQCVTPTVGNPIATGSGNKHQIESDDEGVSAFALKFSRFYNSLPSVVGGMAGGVGSFNRHWRGSYDRSIHLDLMGGYNANVFRPEGKVYTFLNRNGSWVPDGDVNYVLRRLMTLGVPSGWELFIPHTSGVEIYDAQGRFVKMQDMFGNTQLLQYFETGAAAGLLETVRDDTGRALRFSYDTSRRVVTLETPAGSQAGMYTYSYDAKGNLSTVTFPNGDVRTYHYEHSVFPNALTGITDENGVRSSSYAYDAQGRAIRSERAGGADRVDIVYPTATTAIVTRTIDSGLSSSQTYAHETLLGINRLRSITGSDCPSCGPAASTYDVNGHTSSITDWNGSRVNLSFDSRGLEVQKVEGLTATGTTTGQTRTKKTEWHPTLRIPKREAEPLRITTYIYNGDDGTSCGVKADGVTLVPGVVCRKTIHATADANGSLGFAAPVVGSPRTWAYTYNVNGSVLSTGGPRTDVSDVTTYTYYANDAACNGASAVGCRGQVETITNPAGHVARITQYNAHGQPLEMIDPNGLTMTLTYDARMRLTSRDVGGEVTRYQYDAVGQLTRVTLPDGSFLTYGYDAAHRLTEMRDSVGNRIVYTLDLMGNRTKEEVFDPAGQLAQLRTRVYSSLNRLMQDIGAGGQTVSYGYDAQGNVTSVDGPLAGAGDVTTQSYDALNRLVRVIDPGGGQVSYGYNALDQLTAVTDPRNLVTTYSYDGLGNLTQQASPDTGVTTHTYDAAGNILTQTDAKGQMTVYAYDALNRVTSISYHGGIVHAFNYDQGDNGKGRLTRITEPGSVTDYTYDQKGRLISEFRTIAGIGFSTTYRFDAFGRLAGMTYPGGREVQYAFDGLGKVREITTIKDSVTRTVIADAAYRPFGPVAAYTFGNAQRYSRGFDADGRVSSYTLDTQTIAVGYDVASRITSMGDAGNAAAGNTYGYDAVDRLTGYIGPAANQAFTYDGVGNRRSKTTGASTETYSYPLTSNRLAQILGATTRSFSYDPNGSTVDDSLNQYVYDSRGRLAQAVSAGGATSYTVNSVGQRVRKSGPQGDVLYHYDQQGRLIAESTVSGSIQKEYIYLNDVPVALLH